MELSSELNAPAALTLGKYSVSIEYKAGQATSPVRMVMGGGTSCTSNIRTPAV